MEITEQRQRQQEQKQASPTTVLGVDSIASHSSCTCRYDWTTFRQNMSEIAKMGDEALPTDDDNNLKEYRASWSVRKAKRLLDRVVRGLPVLEDASYVKE